MHTTAEDSSIQDMEAIMVSRINTQAVQEVRLVPSALHLVNQYWCTKVKQAIHVEEVVAGRDGHIRVSVAKDPANGDSVIAVPPVVAHRPPVAVEANLDQTLVVHLSPNQSQVTVVANQTGIFG